MTAFAVYNPHAGRTRRDWPRIEEALSAIFPLLSVARTRMPGEAAQLVRQALLEDHLDIVAVGGDGTLNEALNGFFDRGRPLSPDAVLSFVSTGSGGNLRRGFGIAPGWEAGVARLRRARIRKLDVGRVSCLSAGGAPVTRYFLNGASFGLSAAIAARVNHARFARLLGGRLAYRVHSLAALPGWHGPRVRLIAPLNMSANGDHNCYDEIAGITSVAVANGRYFGGGMPVAPRALPNDGLFDLVVMGGMKRRRLLAGLAALERGAHLDSPDVRLLRATRLTAAPTLDTDGPVWVETDGENAGVLPASFEIYPNAINLRV
jgi:YegS/Rv2252/BmrU family lipid kinase